MDMVVNPGSGPVAGATLANAKANLDVFLGEVIADLPPTGTTTAHLTDNLAGQQENGRFFFVVDFLLSDKTIESLTVEMPGLPLEQVKPDAEATDARPPTDFPRLYVDGSSWFWSYAVRAARAPLRRDTAPDDGRASLIFGYKRGLPNVAVNAAWGCRANVNSAGLVDVLHDRQSCFGFDKAIDALLAQLNGGLNTQWKARARELLIDGSLRGEIGREVELLDTDGVRVVANTNGSAGYLYVVAYRKPEDPEAEAGSDDTVATPTVKS